MRNTILFGSILKNVFVVHQGTSAEKGALKVPGSMLQVNKCAPSQGCVSVWSTVRKVLADFTVFD